MAVKPIAESYRTETPYLCIKGAIMRFNFISMRVMWWKCTAWQHPQVRSVIADSVGHLMEDGA